LDKNHYHKILSEYIPEKSISYIIEWLEKHPLHFKITKERQTKHGDYIARPQGKAQITVNHNLNPYSFLITLVHEMAHHVTHLKHKRKVEPHGEEWKSNFQNLMLPLLNHEVFPDDVLRVLAEHLKNPKASSNSDPKLVLVLKNYDPYTDKILLHSLEIGSTFTLNNLNFVLGEKCRTRFECVELSSKKKYLVNQNAEVFPILNSSQNDIHTKTPLSKQESNISKVVLKNLIIGTKFVLNNKQFVLGKIRRTRFECIEIKTKKKYLVPQNAEVILLTKP